MLYVVSNSVEDTRALHIPAGSDHYAEHDKQRLLSCYCTVYIYGKVLIGLGIDLIGERCNNQKSLVYGSVVNLNCKKG